MNDPKRTARQRADNRIAAWVGQDETEPIAKVR